MKFTRSAAALSTVAALMTAPTSASLSQPISEGWAPTAKQAGVVSSTCQTWRGIAGGIYLLKAQGKEKPHAATPLHGKVIDEIYSPKSGVATREAAEAMGEQLCVPHLKEQFRSGKLRVE